MAVEKITPKKIQSIKDKSAYGLPDSPKDAGYKADRVKKAMYEPTLDVVDEVNRIVDQVNGETLQGGQVDYYLAEGGALKRERPSGSGYPLVLPLTGNSYGSFPPFTYTLSENTIISAANAYRTLLYFEDLDVNSMYQVKVSFQAGDKMLFSKELAPFKPVAEVDSVELIERNAYIQDIVATGAAKAALLVQVRVTEGNDRQVTLRIGAGDKASRVSRNEKVTYLPATNIMTRTNGTVATQESLNGDLYRNRQEKIVTLSGSTVEHICQQIVTGNITGKKSYHSCHFVDVKISSNAFVTIDGGSTGTITQKTGTGELNVVSCPELSVSQSINEDNWKSIFIDGVACSPNLGRSLRLGLFKNPSEDAILGIAYGEREAHYTINKAKVFTAHIKIAIANRGSTAAENDYICLRGAYNPEVISSVAVASIGLAGIDSYPLQCAFGNNMLFWTKCEVKEGGLTTQYLPYTTLKATQNNVYIQINYQAKLK